MSKAVKSEIEELKDILSEALWYFGGNEDAQSLAIRCEKLGIKHKEIGRARKLTSWNEHE